MQPVADQQRLFFQPTTLAELLRAAGHFVVVAADVTAREHELQLEAEFLTFDLTTYAVLREPEADCPYTFCLSSPLDAEEVC